MTINHGIQSTMIALKQNCFPGHTFVSNQICTNRSAILINRNRSASAFEKVLTTSLDAIHLLCRLRKGENAFTTAIRTVAEILQDYDYDKQVLGLTFGTNR